MWNRKYPVTFQRFTNNNFKQRLISENEKQYFQLSVIFGLPTWRLMYVEDDTARNWVKSDARKYLQPASMRKCVVMFLTNLENPDWISILCYEKRLSQVLCRIERSTVKSNNTNLLDKEKNKICLGGQIVMNTTCLLFVWTNMVPDIARICNRQGMTNLRIKEIRSLFYFLLATNIALSPVLSLQPSDKRIVQQFTFDKISLKYQLSNKSSTMDNFEGYHTCESKSHTAHTGISVFRCTSGVLVLSLYICNGAVDCPNNDTSDEEFCKCPINKQNIYSRNCKAVYTKENKTICSDLYYLVNGKCYQYFRIKEPIVKKIQNHTCRSGLVIDSDLVNDLHADCISGQDEPILKALLTDHVFRSCTNPYELPCIEGHSKCYNISTICSYRLNRYGHLLPCRNGAHLENCKDFECNMKFKCPNYYCIPYEYICNGIWDCPRGADEIICEDPYRCNYMFKCKGSTSLCIHIGNMCDDIVNCPLGDDELLCEVAGISCPLNCHCLAAAISCNQGALPAEKNILPFMYVFLRSCNCGRFRYLLLRLPQLHYLKLQFMSIQFKDICRCVLCEKLILFDVSFNQISSVRQHCFQGYKQLTALLLNDNLITNMQSQSFFGLFHLKLLNLSNNNILNIPQFIFSYTSYISMISIRNNPLLSINKNAFKNIAVDNIESTSYKICCIVLTCISCNTNKPWYISCLDLLPTKSATLLYLVIFIWVMSVNMISMYLHAVEKSSNASYSMTVILVNFTDLLFGTYLCIIWVANHFFRGNFVSYENWWRHSYGCFAAFGISFWFIILTPCVFLFLALSRLMVVINPVDTKFKKVNYVSVCLFSITIGTMSISAIFTFLMMLTEKQLLLSLCFPLVDPSNSLFITKLTTWSVAIIQFITIHVIMICHFILIKNLRVSQKKVSSTNGLGKDNFPIIFKLILITLSNVICWIPSNIIYLLLSFLHRYPIEIIVWTIISVTSLNSIIVPSVFVITSLRKLFDIKMKKI